MANPSGVNARAAIGRPAETSDYGDPNVTITNMVPLLSESMANKPELDQSEVLTGQSAASETEVVGFTPGGSMDFGLWFEGLEYLFLAALGFENPTVYTGLYGAGSGGSPAPDTASPDAFVHLFECDENLHREPWQAGERPASSGGSTDPTYWTAADQKVRSVSVGIDKTVPADAVHQYAECMVQKMTISLGLDKCGVAFDLVSREHMRDSVMNRDNWVLGARARALLSNTELRIGPVGGSIGTALPIQSFEASLENGLDVSKGSGSDKSIEPIRGDGGRKVTGKFHLGRFSSSQYETWMEDGTDLQVYVTITGPTITGSALSSGLQIILPHVKVLKADFPVAGPGVITGDVEFKASKPASVQPWLTAAAGGIEMKKTNELLLMLTNTRGACFSRDRQAAGITLP